MKRIYSTLRLPIDHLSYADWITRCNQKVSVSTRGIVAFTASFCLNQRRPTTTSYHVYVADINTPYEPYLLVDSDYEFSIVEWDSSGSKLLICDIRGCATIYTSKDYLISDWKPFFKQVFAAETFIAATWYHPGIVNYINLPASQSLKSPSNHLEYGDKVQQSKFGASLRLFGGKSAEGCLLVSSTGLVCCLTLIADGTVDVASESLRPFRSKVEVADICYHKDGSFVIATSAGPINSAIALYQVSLKTRNLTMDEVDSSFESDNKRVSIESKQFYSFHLNIMAQILVERENLLAFEQVSHIKFVTKDSPNDILVEVSGQNLSLIELWELEPKKKTPINSVLLDIKNLGEDVKPNNLVANHEDSNGIQQQQQQQQPTSAAQDDTNSKDWQFKGNYISDKDLVTIQTPKFKLLGNNRQLNLILLAHKDSTLSCLRKEDLQPISEPLDFSTPTLIRSNSNNSFHQNKLYQNGNSKQFPQVGAKLNGSGGPDKPRIQTPFITDLQMTSNQTVIIAIDSLSQLHAIRLPPLVNCQDAKDYENYLQYILEYALNTGNDWWDALVCVDKESIESICDKFHDAYERQPKHLQRKYFSRQLIIRASLYRCINEVSSICKAADCHTMIMLNSVASTLKSMLRSQDQDNPSEHLSNVLKTQGSQPALFNCNNVIAKLNEREFFVEINLIQCLQPFTQWLVELAIFLVSSVPQRMRQKLTFAGAGLASQKEALETIRELLIIIKIWTIQNESNSTMIYKLNSQVDVIGTLYKLISKLQASIGGGESLDEAFVDECIQFRNCVTVPKFSFLLSPIGVASPLLFADTREKSTHHLQLEYFKEPTFPEQVSVPEVEGAINMNGNRVIDVVRNVSLGAHPVINLRSCTRCKSVSLIKSSFLPSRAWEQRWISCCICGGSWVQSDCTTVNKMGYLALLHHNSTISSHNHSHQLIR